MVAEHTPRRKSGTHKSKAARHPWDANYFMESLLYLSFLNLQTTGGLAISREKPGISQGSVSQLFSRRRSSL